MSGSVESHWALSEEYDTSQRAFQIAEELGEPKKTIDELVDFLQTVSAVKLKQYAVAYFHMKNDVLTTFTYEPVIESVHIGSNPLSIFGRYFSSF